MSSVESHGDVRGFYAAIGVQLPGWARTEAPVRCFAAPDAHQHEDRDPSCSVNVHTGLFHCHGCGAAGGAYDAALATGSSPREAIDLMIAHGLIQRSPGRARGGSAASLTTGARVGRRPQQALASAAEVRRLAIDTDRARACARSLCENPGLLARLRRDRGWDASVLRELGVGFDGSRITVPITNDHGQLQGMLRLRIFDWQRPKVKAVLGTRLGLIPRPAPNDDRLLVVEGPSDMLAARSAGLPAVAVPGTDAWRSEWADAFAGREVTVVMDCDRAGRTAATRIAEDLGCGGAPARIVDLAPNRDDGYDLSDWLRAGNNPSRLRGRRGREDARLADSDARAPRAHHASEAPPRPPASRTVGERELQCVRF